MKSLAYVAMPALLLTCVLALGSQAQSQNLSVNIPFDFTAGNARFTAGEYSVKLDHPGLPLLRGSDNQRTFIMTHSATRLAPAAVSSVVFRCYGGNCFLAQIWTAGEKTGLELSPSAAEKRVPMLARQNSVDREILVAGK
jgi:hypothetical protein